MTLLRSQDTPYSENSFRISFVDIDMIGMAMEGGGWRKVSLALFSHAAYPRLAAR